MKLTSRPLISLAFTAFVATPLCAPAQTQHAHVHGQIKLDVAIEGPTVVIEMESPLDNFTGFERAPRTDAEKKTAETVVAQLRAADQIFRIDPVANCKLGPVTLRSPATTGVLAVNRIDGAGNNLCQTYLDDESIALFKQHGTDLSRWPSAVRAKLWS